LKSWGHDEWKNGDKYGRDKYGCPPKSYGDLAFVQHMFASLNSNGKLGVVLPHGILFRGGAEGKIRQGLLQDNKPADRKNKVLIVNGSEDFVDGKNQNTLSDENVKKLSDAFKNYEDVERFCRVIDISEIKENDYNLNIARYVQTTEEEPPVDVVSELRTLNRIRCTCRKCNVSGQSFERT